MAYYLHPKNIWNVGILKGKNKKNRNQGKVGGGPGIPQSSPKTKLSAAGSD